MHEKRPRPPKQTIADAAGLVIWWMVGESGYHTGKLFKPDGSNHQEVRERLEDVELPGRWRRFAKMRHRELTSGDDEHLRRRLEITQKLLKFASSARLLDMCQSRAEGSDAIRIHNRTSLDRTNVYLRATDQLHMFLPPVTEVTYTYEELQRLATRGGRPPMEPARLTAKALSLAVARLAYQHEELGFMAVPRPGVETGVIEPGLSHGPLPVAAPAPSPAGAQGRP